MHEFDDFDDLRERGDPSSGAPYFIIFVLITLVIWLLS